MAPERALAERFRGYAKGKMVLESDLARAAAYLDHLADEVERLQELVRSMVLSSPNTCVSTKMEEAP